MTYAEYMDRGSAEANHRVIMARIERGFRENQRREADLRRAQAERHAALIAARDAQEAAHPALRAARLAAEAEAEADLQRLHAEAAAAKAKWAAAAEAERLAANPAEFASRLAAVERAVKE